VDYLLVALNFEIAKKVGNHCVLKGPRGGIGRHKGLKI
jgi:hypothetical protein